MGVTGSKQVTRPARSTGWSTITRMESMNLSGHETKVEPWWRRLLWPELTNVEDSQLAAKTGSTFAYVVAGMTAAMSFILAPDAATQIGIIVEGILIAALGYGISKMSRACAVAALVIFVGERIALKNFSVLSFFIIAAFVSSVRACFHYHRLRTTPPPLPAEPLN